MTRSGLSIVVSPIVIELPPKDSIASGITVCTSCAINPNNVLSASISSKPSAQLNLTGFNADIAFNPKVIGIIFFFNLKLL